MLEPINLTLTEFAEFWWGALFVYLAFRFVPCFIGSPERKCDARGMLGAEMRRNGLILLSVGLKLVALSIPRVEQHAPWAFVVPLVFLALGPLLRRWRNRPRPTRYTRALGAAQRTPR